MCVAHSRSCKGGDRTDGDGWNKRKTKEETTICKQAFFSCFLEQTMKGNTVATDFVSLFSSSNGNSLSEFFLKIV